MSWEKVKLDTVCDFQCGTQPPKSEWSSEKKDGYVRMLQIRDFTQGKAGFVEYVKDSKTLKKCNDDDVLIGRYGASIGKILTGLSGAYNVAIVKTVPSKKIDNKFLYYYLVGDYFQNFIQNAGSRAAQAGFNKDELSELDLLLPPLATQKKIVTILGQADELRKKNQQLLAQYDVLLQSVFYDMFGVLLKKANTMSIKRLEEFADIKGGLQVSAESRSDFPITVKYLRVANVYRNRLYLSEIKYLKVTDQELKRVTLAKDDILIVEGHGNKSEIGRAAMWDDSIKPIVHQNHLIRVRLNSISFLSPTFLCYFLNSEYGKNQLSDSSNTTSGLNTISTLKVKKVRIVLPPIDLQNKFATIT